MRDTPPGWPRISSAIYYQDAAAAIDWLCKAFGFEIRLRIEGEGGRIEHSELTYGTGMVMVAEDRGADRPAARLTRSPRSLDGANTQAMMVYVDDADAHCDRARAAGAVIVTEPKNTDYGDDYWEDRGYECTDPEGHTWWFCQRIRDGKS